MKNCLKLKYTGINMKHLKDGFVKWWHLQFILKCLKIDEFHHRFLFYFKIYHVLILVFEIFEMPHFSIFRIRKILNERIRFLGISTKNVNAITWRNHLSHAFWGISYYFPYIRKWILKTYLMTLWKSEPLIKSGPKFGPGMLKIHLKHLKLIILTNPRKFVHFNEIKLGYSAQFMKNRSKAKHFVAK